jgi:phosphatidylserine decarboxylase
MFKEARKIVYLFAFLTILVWCLSFVNKILLPVVVFLSILTLLLINFFRDPKRIIKKDSKILYSPADGKIFEIVDTGSNYCIKIFMSIFNVHIQRSPADLKVKDIIYKKGKFIPAGKFLSDAVNEQNIIDFETDKNDRIIVKQIAGVLARRIVCWVKKNQYVSQGEKIGAILLGSQVNIEFPKNGYKILVHKEQRVYAGITALAVKVD